MRAARYDRIGPAREVLSIVEVDVPAPGPDDVRVRLEFSGVNPTDWKRRLLGPLSPGPTQIPNQDGAGVIDAVGERVPAARIGERVWVFHAALNRTGGTAADYVCVPAERAVPLPDGIPLELGASLGIPYITAHAALTCDRAELPETVLVTGGGGAVGHAAIELAAYLGIDVVASASTAEKSAIARGAGARAVLDYRQPDYVAQALREMPGGVDRIIEVALGANIAASTQLLRPHGVVVAYASEAADPALPVRALMTLNATVRFLLVYNLSAAAIESALIDITGALNAGRITAMPTTVFPLDHIADAHEAVEGGILGRVLLDLRS